MDHTFFDALIIGSGAAGLACAVRLSALAPGKKIALYTEGLPLGTSINTGSDKQTYYKLGMYGSEPDSPVLMAKDLMAGGSMHGDLALVEAALSQQTFAHLATLGVPFPQDEFGQYIGYKTDHDPKRRATSCGPYTSREMCLALISEVKKRTNVTIFEKKVAVKLLKLDARCCGCVFSDYISGEFEAVTADDVVFATGGPGGLYEESVYPKVHTGGIGLALEIGAQACNLTESQYGLASKKFRWNVSGSYMQVLPRFISVDDQGVEREFLREYFDSAAAMYDAIFLKGYQWPFSAGHVPGSSLIDIFTYVETMERNRKVYLDYRSDPADLHWDELSAETREYLERSNATGSTPLERLLAMNAPAVELYKQHHIDLATEPLQIAVCAQHCNGGLAGDLWWESVNIPHLYPIGEVNGTHGVTRPGGSALNSGQVGAFRAAQSIAWDQRETLDREKAALLAQQVLTALEGMKQHKAGLDWQEERKAFQHRMSEAGAFIRSTGKTEKALDGVYKQLNALNNDGLGGLDAVGIAESLRNRQLCLAQLYYLECILMQIDYIGSRGGSLVLSEKGEKIHPALPDHWCMEEEHRQYRSVLMTIGPGANGFPQIGWEKCRELPETDGWFETVWKAFREKEFRKKS